MEEQVAHSVGISTDPKANRYRPRDDSSTVIEVYREESLIFFWEQTIHRPQSQ